ncbi:MAG: hypothetical protein KAI66_14995 [Lentisphaeria bacterium]|nr:hypothetical protein [Lentisphaeria bacterium]
MKKLLLVVVVLATVSGVVIQARESAGSGAVRAMQKRRQELRANLLKERVRILAEDEEAAAISRQIQVLYQRLDRIIEDKQSIRQIRKDIREVDTLLSARDADGG